MKIDFLKIVFSLLVIALSSAITNSQTATVTRDGITIATKQQRDNLTSSNFYSLSIGAKEIDGKYVEHKILVDRVNKTYFGYDLEVMPDTENSRFKVSIKPLSLSEERIQKHFDSGKKLSDKGNEMWKNSGLVKGNLPIVSTDILNIKALTFNSLPKYPSEITVGDDDVIAIDLLENPQTKEKITDLIRITAKTTSGLNSLSRLYSEPDRPTKDFSLLDVELQLLRYEVFVNNEKKAESKGGAVGSLLSFYVEGKGLCIFSLLPREQYSFGNISQMFVKAGRIEENKIFFKIGNDEYKIVARSPILAQGGNWNLWMMHIPQFKPSQYTFLYKKDFTFYGTDYMNLILSAAEKW